MKITNFKKSTLLVSVFFIAVLVISFFFYYANAQNNKNILIGSKWEFDYVGINQGDFDPIFAVSNLTLNNDLTFDWIVISDDGEASSFNGTYSVNFSNLLVLKYTSGSVDEYQFRITDGKLFLDGKFYTMVNGDFKKTTVYAKTKETATPAASATNTANNNTNTSSSSSGTASTVNSNTSVIDDNAQSACWVLAKKAVKSQLNSPDSAKFSSTYSNSDVSITNSGNTYTVVSWVKAENGYGATVTSNFFVTMTKSGAGSDTHYTLDSCSIV